MTLVSYQNFDLSVEKISSDLSHYRIRVSSLAAGQVSSEFTLPFSELELENFFLRLGRPRRGVRAIGSPEMQAAQIFGSKLFTNVFTGQVQSALISSLAIARQQGQGLRIRLHLSDAPALIDLPWEFLYDPTQNHFLAYSTVTPLVRYLDLPQTVSPLAIQPPLKLLVMIANPRDHGYSRLDVEDEWHKIRSALVDLEARGLVQVTRLEAATLNALQRQLRREQYHIFHFVGHGGFDNQTQSGVLLLEDEQGHSRMVSGHYLGALLRDHFSLRLALLNACEGARTSRVDPFAGVAQHLVQQGIPAVIAMQFEITDQAAITLAHEFYNALVDSYGVDAALAEARKALYATGNDIEWGTPVLYLRSQSGQLFDLSVVESTRQAETRTQTKIQREATRIDERKEESNDNLVPVPPALYRRQFGLVVGIITFLIMLGALSQYLPIIDKARSLLGGVATPTITRTLPLASSSSTHPIVIQPTKTATLPVLDTPLTLVAVFTATHMPQPTATKSIVNTPSLLARTPIGSESSNEAVPVGSNDIGEVGRKDTLIFGSDISDILTLDPAVVYEFSGIQAEGSVYETLVSFVAGQMGVQPALAESWDITVDGDMWALTFKLNPNAKFASGNPVTADDVVYSWSRAIDLNKSPAFLLIDIGQVKKENLRAVDAQTFQVKIPKGVSPQVFLSVITITVAAVVEKAVVEANAGDNMGSTWLNDNSAGSGPYVLNKWEREVQVVLDANTNYWGEEPKQKRVIMTHIGEAANRQAAIETGDADIVQDLSPEQKTALESNADVQILMADNTLLIYLGMNAMTPPFDNPDVREAVRYAINYEEIMALTGGGAKLVQEVIPAGFLGHTGQTPFKQDIAKAKELLAKAGVPEGTEITALVPADFPAGPIDFPTLAAKIQSDLALAGLTLNLQQLQVSELLNIYRSEEHDKKQMVFIAWGPDYPDPDGNMTPFANYAAKSIAWRNGWDNPEIAEMVAQAAIAGSAEERVQMYADITERIFHEGPYVILYQPVYTYAIRTNIDGFTFDPSDTPSVNFAGIGKK